MTPGTSAWNIFAAYRGERAFALAFKGICQPETAETMKRPSRQAGCFRSMRPVAPCPKCGEGRMETHIPLHVAGTFCSKCCPVCSSQGQDAGDAGKREPVEVKP